ncbi:oxidoreductase [Haloarchaeobius litoreus]|uniref:Oxidoreductase n=1 Tax=Haloarchaeobius litoreus TaxID=755306 RepID=A0ABD6DGW6_9EURY|nr:oxidoreductase [Haloarchaeobius litoreus]
MSNWTAADVPDQSGRTVVVTGANSGLGLEGTRHFADAGATVVMACRSTSKGESAAAAVRQTVPDAELDVRECDLADLDSVASFAAGVDEEYGAVDVLCNNAGVMAIPRSETTDGFETQFGVNHLGHFALTGHLLGALRASDGEARVVSQSSGLHERGEMEFDDLHGEHGYDRWDAYAQSKLANLLFAYELDRRLDAAGIDDVTSVGCHPGYSSTNLQYRGPEASGSWLRLAVMRVANAVVGQSPSVGSLPMVYAATHPGIGGGEYVGPGGFMNMRGAPEVQASNDRSHDEASAQRLWEVSEELTGVTYAFAEQAVAEG